MNPSKTAQSGEKQKGLKTNSEPPFNATKLYDSGRTLRAAVWCVCVCLDSPLSSGFCIYLWFSVRRVCNTTQHERLERRERDEKRCIERVAERGLWSGKVRTEAELKTRMERRRERERGNKKGTKKGGGERWRQERGGERGSWKEEGGRDTSVCGRKVEWCQISARVLQCMWLCVCVEGQALSCRRLRPNV